MSSREIHRQFSLTIARWLTSSETTPELHHSRGRHPSQAVRDAQAHGHVNPTRKTSWSSPDGRDFVATDGTVMLPAYGSGPDDSLGPQIVFNDEKATNKPIGSKVLTTFVHGDASGSRIILRADVVPPGPNGSPGGESEPVARAVRNMAPSLSLLPL